MTTEPTVGYSHAHVIAALTQAEVNALVEQWREGEE